MSKMTAATKHALLQCVAVAWRWLRSNGSAAGEVQGGKRKGREEGGARGGAVCGCVWEVGNTLEMEVVVP